jgi:dihydropteroate synthase
MVQVSAEGSAVAAFAARHQGVRFCVTAASDGPAGGLAAALPADATMIFADARSAAASGLPRDRVLVHVPLNQALAAAAGWPEHEHAPPGRTPPAAAGWPEHEHAPPGRTPPAAAGWPVLIDADRAAALAATAVSPDDEALLTEIIALAALSCWLGAAAVRTRHIAAVRRALDMANSIRGLRPPAHAVRGLA